MHYKAMIQRLMNWENISMSRKDSMRKITYVEAINEALREEMRRDGRVIMMGEDVGVLNGIYKKSRGLLQEFGSHRVLDTPISESGFVGLGVGAAISGLKPVVELMFIDFAVTCMASIVDQAAKLRDMSGGQFKVPIVIMAMIGQGRGVGAEHSQAPISWFMHCPGLQVVAPSTPYDAKGLLKTAIRDDNPKIFIDAYRLFKIEGFVPEEEYTIPFGKADIKREGKDITMVAVSLMVAEALKAAEKLEEQGISVELIDPRTLVPLDKQSIIDSVKKTNKLVIVEPGCKTCGVGAEIASTVMEEAFDYLDAPIQRVAVPNVLIHCSPALEKLAVPNANDIINAVEKIL